LGHLDELLRIKLRGELKNLQRKLGITFIHVTHNQDECLTMGDRLVVMNNGKIEQTGAPHDIYTRPATFFVAAFVGDNFILTGDIKSAESARVSILTDFGCFKVDTTQKVPVKNKQGGFSIRADLITLDTDTEQKFDNELFGVVEFVEYVGYIVKLRVRIDGINNSGQGAMVKQIIVKQNHDQYFKKQLKEGDKVKVGWAAKDAVFLTGSYSVKDVSLYGS